MTNEDLHDAVVLLLNHTYNYHNRRIASMDEGRALLTRIAEGPCPRCDGTGSAGEQ